jgi:hypothetical protein
MPGTANGNRGNFADLNRADLNYADLNYADLAVRARAPPAPTINRSPGGPPLSPD